jgi:hypothetical protein
LSARDGAADCLKKTNPRRIHKANLSLTGEKRGQADVGDRCPGERFTWGRTHLQDAGEVRRRYIESLKAADGHNVGPLLAFARS